jgi:hypothetical protein
MGDTDDAEAALKQTSPYFQWFVYNAKDSWKWFSTWFAGAIAIAPLAMEYIPALDGILTPTHEHWMYAALGVLTYFGRIANQKPKVAQ